jgi:hypothetical protein
VRKKSMVRMITYQAHQVFFESSKSDAAEVGNGRRVWRSVVRKWVFAVLGVLFIALATAPLCQAEEQFAAQWVTGDGVSVAANYWTKARMTNARPYPTPNAEGGPTRLALGALEQPSDPPGSDPGSKGGNVSLQLSEGDAEAPVLSGIIDNPEDNGTGVTEDEAEAPSEISDSGVSAVKLTSNGYDYPPPHTTFKVAQSLYGTTTSSYPYRAIGKVFFTKGGSDYVCSGSSIGGRAVLTAGHCVSDGKGTFHSNWVFVPACKKNSKPYGTWTAFRFFVFDAWHNKADYSRDVAFAVVNDLDGKKLSAKVGSLGFSYNQPTVQHWNAFGYPRSAPWDGQYLVETQASFATLDASYTPNTIGIGTAQTDGCSGGPWIRTFVPDSSGGSNYANGVYSYAYTKPNQPNQIYSPYFDSLVKSMKDAAVAK